MPLTGTRLLEYKVSGHKLAACEHFVLFPAPELPEPPTELKDQWMKIAQQEIDWASCPEDFAGMEDLEEQWSVLSGLYQFSVFGILQGLLAALRTSIPRSTSPRIL